MNARTLSASGTLGVRTENTIDALKEQLGVDRLTLVVLDGIEEYTELLVEVPPTPPRWSWRKRLLFAVLLLSLLGAFAGLVHPGVRLDRLVRHISIQVQ